MPKTKVKPHTRTLPTGKRTYVKGHARYTQGESERLWFHPKGSLSGWNKNLSKEDRMQRLKREIRNRGGDREAVVSVGRALIALANVTRDAKTEQRARADARDVFRM